MKANVAVIGAGGFIGRHLCERLESLGSKVEKFGRKSGNAAGLTPLDFDNEAELVRLGREFDVLYFLASETIPASSWNNPLTDIDANLRPFVRLCDKASAAGLNKCVFISSAGTVYGTTSGKVGEDADKKPFSPYGIIKLAMENYLEYFRRRSGMNYDVFRVSNVYGAGQNTGKGLGIINTFLEKIINGEEIVVYGDGSAMRNYIYVTDVAELMALSLGRSSESGIFNLASDSAATVSEVLGILEKVCQEKVKVRYEPGRLSDNSYIDLDNSRIKSLAGSFTFTGLEQGIASTYKALKKTTTHKNV